MKLLRAAMCLIPLAPLAAAKAQQVDPSAVIDQLTQWTMEDIARQRARAGQQEADDEAQRNLPDLSQYGTPVEVPRRQQKRPKSSNEIQMSKAPQMAEAASGVAGHVSCSGRSVGISIDINGEIDEGTVESVSKLFEELHQQEKKIASGVKCDDSAAHQNLPDLSAYGNHFGINSRGGSVPAAMAIGRMIRREGAWIGVNGVCYSACVFILAAAVDRQIGKSDQVGIHRPYMQTTPEKPIDADQVKQAYSRTLQDMRSYLREMNVSPRLADDMLATEPEHNHILSETELRAYRLIGVDPAEQQRRAIQKEAADVKEANQLGLDRREYTRRKMLGEKICAYSANGAVADGRDYEDCKIRFLKTGN
jgi:ATP-dependent protease ClpP protease subunit